MTALAITTNEQLGDTFLRMVIGGCALLLLYALLNYRGHQ